MIHIPKTKIWEACGDDEDRPMMNNPMFYPNTTITPDGEVYHEDDKGTLLAADGFKAVFLMVSHDPEDLEGHIPVEALKAASKVNKQDTLFIDASQEEYVSVGFGNVPQLFRRYWQNDEGEWVKLAMLNLEQLATVIQGRLAGDPELVTVKLNFDYLGQITEALKDYIRGSRRTSAFFEITVRTDQAQMHKPVLITPNELGLGFAIQMPMNKRG